MKPVSGTPILRASVEAKRVSDLCTTAAASGGARGRILAWLAEGAREVTWALCSLPRERWAEVPPDQLSDWPVLRHARHLVLRETHVTLPTIRQALGDIGAEAVPSTVELEQADAAWDAAGAIESAEAIVQGLGETRFELLQWLESAPDDAWERPIPQDDPSGIRMPLQLDWLMLRARQHELEHLAAIWRVALHWDHAVTAPQPTVAERSCDEQGIGLRLHPADRPEESH